MTLDKHLADNADAIEAEAQDYAKHYGCSIDIARRDVSDAYAEGYCAGVEARRCGDWDYGQE